MRRLNNRWTFVVADSLLIPGVVAAAKRFILSMFLALPVWFGWIEI